MKPEVIVQRLNDVAGFIQEEHGRVAASASLAIEAATLIEKLLSALQRIEDTTSEPLSHITAVNARQGVFK